MSIRIDIDYIINLSGQLDKFTKKGDYTFNCRCPICGDSQKSKSKARGYFYKKLDDMFYKCHNCGYGSTVGNLIKEIDPTLYKQYRMERWTSGENGFSNYKKPTDEELYPYDAPVFNKLNSKHAVSINNLSDDHIGKEYLSARKLPDISDFYWCDDFAEYVNDVLPNKYPVLVDTVVGEGRILIPFYNRDKQLTHVQGRAVSPEKHDIRYVTLGFLEEQPKVFGLDKVNLNKRIYVVEGPFDSLFLPNCIAMGGGDCNALSTVVPKEKVVVVMDNEPRNRDTIKRMEKYMDLDYTITFFPDTIKEKDINDMILRGIDQSEIVKIINKNTYKGVGANLKLSEWRKVR